MPLALSRPHDHSRAAPKDHDVRGGTHENTTAMTDSTRVPATRKRFPVAVATAVVKALGARPRLMGRYSRPRPAGRLRLAIDHRVPSFSVLGQQAGGGSSPVGEV